jgi:hypothetical protein
MTSEFSCTCLGRDTNVQCVCLFLMMETTANSALIKIAVVIAGLDLRMTWRGLQEVSNVELLEVLSRD